MALNSPHFQILKNGDINITRAVDASFSIACKVNNVAVDLTGYTVFFTVRKMQDTTDALDTLAVIKKTITVIPNPTLGIVSVPLTRADLQIETGKYYYAIDLKTASGDVYKALEAIFTITYNSANRTF